MVDAVIFFFFFLFLCVVKELIIRIASEVELGAEGEKSRMKRNLIHCCRIGMCKCKSCRFSCKPQQARSTRRVFFGGGGEGESVLFCLNSPPPPFFFFFFCQLV